MSCVALVTLVLGAAAAHAQSAAPDAPCDGSVVSRIEIRSLRPSFEGVASRWRNAARAIGLHHATTRTGVVDAFVVLEVDAPCTELRRAESERVLRAQTFIADASVRAIPDGPGRVAVLVETTDEMGILVGGQFRGIAPRALTLGNGNVGGLGLLLQANIERGYAYQTGVGARIVEYAAFGRPYVASLEAERYTVGHLFDATLGHPFYTDLQHVGWHVGYRNSHDYPRLRRPAYDNLALAVRQERWEASTLSRVFGTRTVGLLGFGTSGLRLSPDSAGVVVSESGLAPDTGSTLNNRYLPFRSGRIGVLGGVRRVGFRTVRGFDGLTAPQDVANGVAAGLFVAKGLPSLGESDLFLSGALYAGVAGDRVLLATLAQVEGRRADGRGEWDSVIGSARTAFYWGSAPGFVFVADDRWSGGTRSRLPLQLALGDRQGGMIGYHSSPLAGAVRNIARTEVRFSRTGVFRHADMGVATFGELGTVWAGDAPYGANATRAAVGVSLIAAYPGRSKRMYRADIGFPISGGAKAGIEVRFSSEDRTNIFLREPDDVTRARTGAVPSALFAWPTR